MLEKTKSNISSVTSRPEILFVVIASFFGLLFVFFTPPLQGPDEQAHFAQAYTFASGNKVIQEEVPKSIKDTYKIIFYNDDIRFESNQRYETYRTSDARSISLNEQQTVPNDGFLTGTGYSPIGYLFSIIGIIFGRIINAAPVEIIYIARLFGLIGWVILFALAIRISPIGKWAFFVLGVLPMTLFQASVISVDSMMLAMLALFVAFVFYLAEKNKTITYQNTLLLVLFGVAAVLSKQVALFILPIALLLCLNIARTAKGSGKIVINVKNLLVIMIVLILSSAAMLAWTRVAGTTGVSTNMPAGVDPSLQVQNLVQNPTEFIYALRNTFVLDWGEDISRSFIGTFGWMDAKMTIPVIAIGYVILFLGLVANRGEDIKKIPLLSKKIIKLGLLVLILLFWFVVTFILYAYNTPVNFNIVFGLQGRYYLPLVLLLIPLFINKDQLVMTQAAKGILLKILPVILLSASILYLYIRYYVNTLI